MRLDHRPDAMVGQDFQEQRVLDATIDDVYALDAVARGVKSRADLRKHATGELSLIHI